MKKIIQIIFISILFLNQTILSKTGCYVKSPENLVGTIDYATTSGFTSIKKSDEKTKKENLPFLSSESGKRKLYIKADKDVYITEEYTFPDLLTIQEIKNKTMTYTMQTTTGSYKNKTSKAISEANFNEDQTIKYNKAALQAKLAKDQKINSKINEIEKINDRSRLIKMEQEYSILINNAKKNGYNEASVQLAGYIEIEKKLKNKIESLEVIEKQKQQEAEQKKQKAEQEKQKAEQEKKAKEKADKEKLEKQQEEKLKKEQAESKKQEEELKALALKEEKLKYEEEKLAYGEDEALQLKLKRELDKEKEKTSKIKEESTSKSTSKKKETEKTEAEKRMDDYLKEAKKQDEKNAKETDEQRSIRIVKSWLDKSSNSVRTQVERLEEGDAALNKYLPDAQCKALLGYVKNELKLKNFKYDDLIELVKLINKKYTGYKKYINEIFGKDENITKALAR